jgi:cytochrome c peroxidase
MVMSKKQFTIIFIFIAGIIACNKNIVDEVFAFVSPTHFSKPAYNFSNNEITKAKFELGRKLFYDPLLSANNTISCGSCHIQTSAFTHHGHIISHGIYDRMGTRNSPPIMNLAWNTSFMWDGGIVDLDLQPIAPINNHVEMDDSMPNVLNKLRNSSTYPTLFKNAFGNSGITGANFLKALSQFMLMCVSSNSKYDSVQQNLASFTTEENAGYQTFKQKCSSCHKEPLFTDYSFRNNGLQPSAINDLGRYPVTNNESDKYKFKVPSLRNLSYTAPYMHDGRLLTLDAVFDHYTTNVQATQNLDPILQQGSILGIPLTAQEKSDIKAFLKTLDDKSFLLDKKLSEQ